MRVRGLLLLLFLFIISTQAIQAIGIESFSPSCNIQDSSCNYQSESVSGDCRTIFFNSPHGQIKISSCIKGDYLEVYRQEYPSGVQFQACLSTACIDEIKGFERKLISDLDSQTNPDQESPIENPVQNETGGENTPPINFQPPIDSEYPINMNDVSPSGEKYSDILEKWNDATWQDIVDDSFSSGLASVRWYNTEGTCTGEKCQDQLHNGHGACPTLSVSQSRFCGVTDEFSNVLLNHAMGSNQERYDKLHRFSEKLRHPEANNLQCWKYYVSGKKNYGGYETLCVSKDSASDASIRILGAYGLACAKQNAGIWNVKDIDYCKDYEEQGKAIWGIDTKSHGEIKKLSNGRYFLCNGYGNQASCPSSAQSIRPDYYELQFLMDFAYYMESEELKKSVFDFLDSYYASLGNNMVHSGKTGSFNSDGITGYKCTDLCSPPYMDNIDSWRAIPALSGLYNSYNDELSSEQKKVFDYWWANYVSPHSYNSNLPFEIYSSSSNGKVKSSENSYKTLSMWIPLSVQKDPNYAENALNHLIGKYNNNNNQFSGAAYYGGYFSQFAQRAIGSSTGMIDPYYWNDQNPGSPTPEEEQNDSVQPPISSEESSSSSGSGSGGSSGSSDSNLESNSSSEQNNSKNMNIQLLSIPITCEIEGSECELKKDVISEDKCRDISYFTRKGTLKVEICEISQTTFEMRRKIYPSKIEFNICAYNSCISERDGIVKIEALDTLKNEVNRSQVEIKTNGLELQNSNKLIYILIILLIVANIIYFTRVVRKIPL